jgi:hypothetical protein
MVELKEDLNTEQKDLKTKTLHTLPTKLGVL